MKPFLFSLPLFCLLACNATKTPSTPAPTVDGGSTNEQKIVTAGNDFFAAGNAPVNWSFEMDADAKINFRSDDGLNLSFASNKLKKVATVTTTTYTATIDAGDVSIVVREGDCTVPTMRMMFSRTVAFTFKGKTYTGCGKFLADANLNGKWNLEKIGNTAISAGDYNKLPFLNFDLDKNRVNGTDGCNSVSGNLEVQGNRIKFAPMISTRMACAKNDISAKLAMMTGERPVDYKIVNGKLQLILSDDSVLVFTRG